MKPKEPRSSEIFYKVNVAIIGDSGVGKSSMLLRYCDNDFKSIYTATVGVDYKFKMINIEGIDIRLKIWDTAGQ